MNQLTDVANTLNKLSEVIERHCIHFLTDEEYESITQEIKETGGCDIKKPLNQHHILYLDLVFGAVVETERALNKIGIGDIDNLHDLAYSNPTKFREKLWDFVWDAKDSISRPRSFYEELIKPLNINTKEEK